MSDSSSPDIASDFDPSKLSDEQEFSVDAELFRELGEHLVGQPHIALAELVKNSYDADARVVEIRFTEDAIEIADNGHGMTFKEFRDYWMRVGSRHKEREEFSPYLDRPLTGSKGIGRLAAQFLAKRLKMTTVRGIVEPVKRIGNLSANAQELRAYVDWSEAVRAGDMSRASARYDLGPPRAEFPDESEHGTRILLRGLNHKWDAEKFGALAKEIWWLEPPFSTNPNLPEEQQDRFRVELTGPDQEAVQTFDEQMNAILEIWHAKLVGSLKLIDKEGDKDGDDEERPGFGKAEVEIDLEFADGDTTTYTHDVENALIHELEFQIRIYHLKYRQPKGIKVREARDYLNTHGGVHVYDAGFHLPYYGVDHDWLNTEQDHAHRLSKTDLIPEDLQVERGMNYLPTQSRILGVVHVNTAAEARFAKAEEGVDEQTENLKIQLSRDRLVDNEAYRQLRSIVRASLDFYAMEEARRQFAELEEKRDVEEVQEKFERVDKVLETYKEHIPEEIYEELGTHISEAIDASETEAERRAQRAGLLGSLATAGMSALAHQHEAQKQLTRLESVSDRLRRLEGGNESERATIEEIATELQAWIEQARDTRRMFSPLMEAENRQEVRRLRARALLRDVVDQMRVILRGVDVRLNAIDRDLRLPKGRFVEWSAIFQNLFTNAVNAMLDSDERVLHVESRDDGDQRSLVVSDTGKGVDLKDAEELFQPFERRLKISPERRQLGYGGTGLGLTIVRMLCVELDCTVRFVEPREDFSTSLEITWTEK